MLVIGSGLSNQNLLAFDGQSRRNVEQSSSRSLALSQTDIHNQLFTKTLVRTSCTLVDSLRCCVTTSQRLINSNM